MRDPKQDPRRGDVVTSTDGSRYTITSVAGEQMEFQAWSGYSKLTTEQRCTLAEWREWCAGKHLAAAYTKAQWGKRERNSA